jgi:hypothetical protein
MVAKVTLRTGKTLIEVVPENIKKSETAFEWVRKNHPNGKVACIEMYADADADDLLKRSVYVVISAIENDGCECVVDCVGVASTESRAKEMVKEEVANRFAAIDVNYDGDPNGEFDEDIENDDAYYGHLHVYYTLETIDA